jgi:carbonic anhydrase
MDGNARYAAGSLTNRDFSAGRAARAAAQYPFAAVLSCADSRISPELAFDQGPGDLFVVRLAGNFVNDDGLASLEYGTRFLGVPLVMVLGHSNCGAVAAAIKVLQEGIVLRGHLPALVNSIKPAVETAKQKRLSDLLEEATAENVRLNVKRLTSAEPILSEMTQQGKVRVVGGVYDITTGKVNLL